MIICIVMFLLLPEADSYLPPEFYIYDNGHFGPTSIIITSPRCSLLDLRLRFTAYPVDYHEQGSTPDSPSSGM